jgi:acyl carrier protein
MEINDFIKNFAEQFDETDINEFYADSNFRDIKEWSSFNALSIIAMADEEYSVKLTGDDIIKSTTIKDIFEIVKSRQ